MDKLMLITKRSCLALLLGLVAASVPVGCGGGEGGDAGQVEIDPAEIQAEQDAIRANMEKAYSKGGGQP